MRDDCNEVTLQITVNISWSWWGLSSLQTHSEYFSLVCSMYSVQKSARNALQLSYKDRVLYVGKEENLNWNLDYNWSVSVCNFLSLNIDCQLDIFN